MARRSWAKDRERTQMRNSEALSPKGGSKDPDRPAIRIPDPEQPGWMKNPKLLPKRPPSRKPADE